MLSTATVTLSLLLLQEFSGPPHQLPDNFLVMQMVGEEDSR